MLSRVGSPRAPGLRDRAKLGRARGPDRMLQSDIRERERVGPIQRPHGDCRRNALADTADLHERQPRLFDIAPGFELKLALDNGARDGRERGRPPARDPQCSEVIGASLRYLSGGWGEVRKAGESAVHRISDRFDNVPNDRTCAIA